MSVVETLADVLGNYRKYRRPGSTNDPGDHLAISVTVVT